MRRTFLLIALTVLVIAAALRIAGLHTYPPGPHYDEAAELLIARSIAFGGARHFPIVESYQGREALYYYVTAPLLRLVADDIFTLRLVSVYANLITIAASIALGRAMSPGWRGGIIGLAIGVLMAVNFNMIFNSRQAFRSVLLPLCQAVGLWLLWRGLGRRRAWPSLIAAGVMCGLALYTYMASRLFPVWLAIAGLALLWLDRARWRLRLRQGAIFFAALIVTAAPMIGYALRRPDVFWGRLAEVTGTGADVTLAESIRRHLLMFFVEGEGYVRYNVPGRPYFTLPEGLLLLAGLGVAVYRLTRGRSLAATERAGYLLALLAPLMVIPSVVSLGGLPPSFMRSLGMVPLIFVLAAIGLEAILPRRGMRPTWLLAAILILAAPLAWETYITWARRADLFYQSDADLAAAARWLPDQVDDRTLVYAAAYHREHPTLIALYGGPITWLGTDSLFLPPPGMTGLVIAAHDLTFDPAWQSSFSEALAPGALADLPPGPDGGPAFFAYRIASDAVEAPTPAVRSDLLAWLETQISPTAAGQRAVITSAWRVERTPPYYRLRPVISLRDCHGLTIAEGDAFLLGTNTWRPGEVMFQQVSIALPPATPPGLYTLQATWIDRDSEVYVNYLDSEGAFAGITAPIGTLEVTAPQTFPALDALNIPIRVEQMAAPGVMLAGYATPRPAIRPGEPLTPVITWQAAGPDRADFIARALLRYSQETITLWEGTPVDRCGDPYMASEWREGDILSERMVWPTPRDLPGGVYQLALQTDTAEFDLGRIEVASIGRVFEAPPVEVPLDVTFGESIGLHGYTLERTEDTLTLDLVWSARAPVEAAYTVFVHGVDATGAIVDQRDRQPQDNTYPTTLWLPGEYVPDRYTFDGLPPGVVTLRIGLYLQQSGGRLPVRDPAGALIGDFLVVDAAWP
jgi:4-amino-4-deoxy-L-arabinose transferase-like glycosyltransferase